MFSFRALLRNHKISNSNFSIFWASLFFIIPPTIWLYWAEGKISKCLGHFLEIHGDCSTSVWEESHPNSLQIHPIETTQFSHEIAIWLSIFFYCQVQLLVGPDDKEKKSQTNLFQEIEGRPSIFGNHLFGDYMLETYLWRWTAVSENWGAPLNFWKTAHWGLTLGTSGLFGWVKTPKNQSKKFCDLVTHIKNTFCKKIGSKRPFQPSVVVRAIYISLFGVATAN